MSTNSDDRSSPAERVDKAANKILFIGFLCNTDSSILKLKLGNGYRVKSMDEPAGIQHIAFAEKLPVEAIYERLTISDPCLIVAEKKFYMDANQKGERILRVLQTNHLTSTVPFTLTEDELPKLQEFLKVTKLPFPKQFLRLAFSLFETSYTLRERALSFL